MTLQTVFSYFGTGEYWLTRMVFQRGLALVYVIAFVVALNQFIPLLGEHGLLPVSLFVKHASVAESPSLFFLFPKDWAFKIAAWIGLVLAIVALTGFSEKHGWWLSIAVWGSMWVLYLSFVNVGQVFYGFGWESMLLEAGFLAIFLGDEKTAPSVIMIFLIRWMLFRTMLGAGLIKLRGDSCWKDLTCLIYHYETQPMPNPLSWYFHWLPRYVHQFGVLFNHVAELIVPFGYFLMAPVAAIAGLITLLFHGWLFVSGNFSFLGLLTMVLALSTLNDKLLAHILPIAHPINLAAPPHYQIAVMVYAVVVIIISIFPIKNFFSSRQVMNASYEPFHLVNSYGAFGAITRPRYEVIVEGTDEKQITPQTQWREYEFKGKPGNIYRSPPQIAPYHLRLDWLMWFAGFSPYYEQPWFVNLVAKLLQNDRATLSLMGKNPFADHPPTYIKALLYEYHFTTRGERAQTGAWWKRTLAGDYFPAVSMDDPQFRSVLQNQGWLP